MEELFFMIELFTLKYIKGFEDRDEMGTTINYKKQFFKRRYLDDFDYVTFLNHGVMRGKR